MTVERQQAELDKIVDSTGEWDDKVYTEEDYEEMELFMKEFDRKQLEKKSAEARRAKENIVNFKKEADSAGLSIKDILFKLIDTNWRYEDMYVPISMMGMNVDNFDLKRIGDDLINYLSELAEKDFL